MNKTTGIQIKSNSIFVLCQFVFIYYFVFYSYTHITFRDLRVDIFYFYTIQYYCLYQLWFVSSNHTIAKYKLNITVVYPNHYVELVIGYGSRRCVFMRYNYIILQHCPSHFSLEKPSQPYEADIFLLPFFLMINCRDRRGKVTSETHCHRLCAHKARASTHIHIIYII